MDSAGLAPVTLSVDGADPGGAAAERHALAGRRPVDVDVEADREGVDH